MNFPVMDTDRRHYSKWTFATADWTCTTKRAINSIRDRWDRQERRCSNPPAVLSRACLPRKYPSIRRSTLLLPPLLLPPPSLLPLPKRPPSKTWSKRRTISRRWAIKTMRNTWRVPERMRIHPVILRHTHPALEATLSLISDSMLISYNSYLNNNFLFFYFFFIE